MSNIYGNGLIVSSFFFYFEIQSFVKLIRFFICLAVNQFFETILPSNPRNNSIDIPSNSRAILYDFYWIRYCGLNALLEGIINKYIYTVSSRIMTQGHHTSCGVPILPYLLFQIFFSIKNCFVHFTFIRRCMITTFFYY